MSDHETPGGTPDTLPLLPSVTDDVEHDSAEAYGSAKVACEQEVQARAREALVIRPGLIIGPGDLTDPQFCNQAVERTRREAFE